MIWWSCMIFIINGLIEIDGQWVCEWYVNGSSWSICLDSFALRKDIIVNAKQWHQWHAWHRHFFKPPTVYLSFLVCSYNQHVPAKFPVPLLVSAIRYSKDTNTSLAAVSRSKPEQGIPTEKLLASPSPNQPTSDASPTMKQKCGEWTASSKETTFSLRLLGVPERAKEQMCNARLRQYI